MYLEGKITRAAKPRYLEVTVSVLFLRQQQLLIHQEAETIVTDFWLIFATLCLSFFQASILLH